MQFAAAQKESLAPLTDALRRVPVFADVESEQLEWFASMCSQVWLEPGEVYVEEGKAVRKGQVLARLDPSLLRAQLEQATAGLARANAEAERLRVSLEDARIKLARATALSEWGLTAAADLEEATYNPRAAWRTPRCEWVDSARAGSHWRPRA